MSSLWTPGGEHKVPRANEPDNSPEPGGPEPGGVEPAFDGRGDEPTEEELIEFTRQLASAPPEDVVANHVYGLFELAALHLSTQPPRLDAARLAIDAMTMLVDGLGDRLGDHAVTLREGLDQIRLAYVRLAGLDGAGAPAG